MKKKAQKFVALNVSLPLEQKDELLRRIELQGFATVSEYIRSLIRNDISTVHEATHPYGPEMISDDLLTKQMVSFAPDTRDTEDSSRQKVRTALDLLKRGTRIKTEEIRRNNPNASEREIQMRLANWIRNKPGATYGDGDGQPNFERLARIQKHATS